jgi:RNA polymerase sigma-70 factor (ECF subfamily)
MSNNSIEDDFNCGDMAPLEKRILTAWEAAEFQQAATISIRSYGPEILGFLVAFTQSRSEADDIFSYFLEDFWRGLPGFEWRCTLRSWAYTLAKHAAYRFFARSRERRGHVPISRVPELAEVEREVRTSTAHYLRTTVKTRLRILREQLPMEEQMILTLRIDRNLSWRDIAVIMNDNGVLSDEDALTTAEATWRKRFERAKDKLKHLAAEEGIIPPE